MELRSNHFVEKKKNLFAFVLFVLFWFAVVLFSGTLTSGYHFTDDHGIISIDKSISETGFLNTCKSVVVEDFSIRLRSVYYLHRVVETKLFGTHFMLWSAYTCFLAVLTSFFLYLFLQRQGYSFLNALLFSLLTLIGNQSAIWWRTAPAETIGIFFLSVALFFLANSIFREKKYQFAFSFFFLLLATLSKESFIFFVPAYILLLLWLQQQKQPTKTIFELVKSNIILLLSLCIVVLVELYIIVFLVGTNKIGYAGTDEHFSLFKLMKFIYYQLPENYLYFFLALFGGFLILQSVKNITFKSVLDVKKIGPYVFNILILLAIIAPQYIVYTKSGLNERYLIPFVLGFTIFISFIFHQVEQNKNITLFTKRAFALVIFFVILFYFKKETFPNAKGFALQGRMTQKFLSTIIDHTKENDSILVVMNPYANYEWSYSIEAYLKQIGNKKTILFYPVATPLTDDFSKSINKQFFDEFKDKITPQLSDRFACIAIFPFSGNTVVKKEIDTTLSFRRIDFDTFDYFTVYVKGERP